MVQLQQPLLMVQVLIIIQLVERREQIQQVYLQGNLLILIQSQQWMRVQFVVLQQA